MRTLYFIVLESSGRIHPHTVILRGLLLYYSIRRKDQRSCMGGMEVGEHNIWTTLSRIFSKTGISYYNINFAERNSEAAMGMGGNIFRVQGSSIRVQRSSVGCSVAQKGAAELRRVQRSSEECSVAQ